MTVIARTQAVSKSFGPPPSLVSRLSRRIGLPQKSSRTVYAVNQVDLEIAEGEVLGLVGESGCGKSTLGRMVAGILNPSSGEIQLRDAQSAQRPHRTVQMVFQNPYASLNPRMRIGDLVSEAALYHRIISRGEQTDFVSGLLRQVGLEPSYASRYPHQFSGGQRQRIAIARALALNPSLVVCDEAVSALDVSIQAQILNLFQELREKRHLAYLFISHNLSVIEYIADRVAIMYLGRIVEIATTSRLFSAPTHPYTQALVADAPRMDAKPISYKPIGGEMPSPLAIPHGCPFHPRCPHAMAVCREVRPALSQVSERHWSACHLNPPPDA